ncbi:MAG: hypothetical protein ACLUUO_07910 [Sellimonas intestinalis]
MIEIDEIDYGIWYLDAMEHPEHYKNKKLKFLAQVYREESWALDFLCRGVL